MSETLDLTSVVTEEPTVTEVVEDVEPSEPEEPAEVATEEPAEVTTEEPAEVASEEPVEVATEEPAEEPVEPAEEPVEPAEEPVEPAEEPAEVTPVEQVASDIRSILTEVPTTPVESVESVVSEQLCSLKTLVDVLGKWSSNEIRRRQVEDLLKEGTEVDENLDDLEKIPELISLWMTDTSQFKNNPDNYFLKLDTYELVGESRNLSDNKKKEVLNKLTELSINASHRRLNTEQINEILNNIY